MAFTGSQRAAQQHTSEVKKEEVKTWIHVFNCVKKFFQGIIYNHTPTTCVEIEP